MIYPPPETGWKALNVFGPSTDVNWKESESARAPVVNTLRKWRCFVIDCLRGHCEPATAPGGVGCAGWELRPCATRKGRAGCLSGPQSAANAPDDCRDGLSGCIPSESGLGNRRNRPLRLGQRLLCRCHCTTGSNEWINLAVRTRSAAADRRFGRSDTPSPRHRKALTTRTHPSTSAGCWHH